MQGQSEARSMVLWWHWFLRNIYWLSIVYCFSFCVLLFMALSHISPVLLALCSSISCATVSGKASQHRGDISSRQIKASPINFAFLCLLNTQSTKGKMSLKQARSCHVADNYHQAPQKCQYVKMGAVCEMNKDKLQALRSPDSAAWLQRPCLKFPTVFIWWKSRQHKLAERSCVP